MSMMDGGKFAVSLSDRISMKHTDDCKDDGKKELVTVTTCLRPGEDGTVEFVSALSGVTDCDAETTSFFKCLFNSTTKGSECKDKLASLDKCMAKTDGLTQTKEWL